MTIAAAELGAISDSAEIQLPVIETTASGRRWRLREADPRETLAIAQKACIDPVLARIVCARGITHQNAADYLSPSLRASMPDPVILKDMDRAVARLSDAIRNGERVGVFGDYDVDGTTAAAIFRTYFDWIGVPLSVYLPDRIAEGYGPSIEAFRTLKSEGVKLIVTVDCGASAHIPIEQAAAEGLDIIVIDHHQMDGPPPAGAIATVNPNRPDDLSGLTNLSAAGVAFMAVVAFNRVLREADYFPDKAEPDLRRLLDLTALGLVCDVMPITGLTRVLVAQGLKAMSGAGGNAGLAALGERAGVKGPPSTYHLGFLLGPRINAAGRIGHALLAFELLTTNDPARRNELAERLHIMNAERQEIEAQVQAAAIRDIEMHQRQANDVVIAAGEGWHPGVIGIVAGRLKEIYDKPVIVIGLDEAGGKGSGRSIPGVDLGAAIVKAKHAGLLTAGGGHMMAAGLSIEAGKIEPLRKFLNKELTTQVREARQNRTLEIDAVIAPSAVSKTFADLVATAGPYGPGNPEPAFALADMRVDYPKMVGKGHLTLTLTSNTGEQVRAIAFRADGGPLAEILMSGGKVHVAGKIRADDWRGGDAGQLQISDAALAV